MADNDQLMEYTEQLQQVNQALNVAEKQEDIENLLSLRASLQQLVELLTSDNDTTSEEVSKPSAIDEEYAMFMAEMVEEGAVESTSVPSSSGNSTDCNNDTAKEKLIAELKALEGTKCMAPHCDSWGNPVYHNALISSVLYDNEDENVSYEDLKVKVLFTNPVQNDMLPCPYFLDMKCRFSDEKCRFSHGEVISFSSLQEYVEPDFETIDQGSFVLAKHEDGLWYRGTVKNKTTDEQCVVRLEKNKKVVIVPYADILPMSSKEDNVGSDSDSDLEPNEDERDDIINNSLLITPTDERLGGWEKHTKGIGSKLMMKMGYVIGTGLGRMGEGRVEPVTAVVLPPGKSLDHCMDLREKAGGDKNLFSAERKLKRQARKQEARNKKVQPAPRYLDVFHFLNNKLVEKKFDDKMELSKSEHRKVVGKETNHYLNVESYKIEQQIKDVEDKIVGIRQSLQRHSNSQASLHAKFHENLKAKQDELIRLKTKLQNIKHEQSLRHTTRKLTVF